MELQYKNIGQRIQNKRKALKIKQSVLAEKINISNNHLSAIENGRQIPSLSTFVNICENLQVTPDYILLGNTHPPNIPESVITNLRLCSNEDIKLATEFTELLVQRNEKKLNSNI